jgi:hypothetical protein
MCMVCMELPGVTTVIALFFLGDPTLVCLNAMASTLAGANQLESLVPRPAASNEETTIHKLQETQCTYACCEEKAIGTALLLIPCLGNYSASEIHDGPVG